MNIINLHALSFIDFHFIGQNYSFIFFIAILTLALSVVLKSTKVFIAQLALLLSFALVDGTLMFLPIFVITFQLLMSSFVFYRYKKAIDRNYQLILEKTHQIPRKLTKTDNGSKQSFL